MKNSNYFKKMTLIGAGCGVVLFAVFGLLPGSYLGGVMGLNLSGMIFGFPVASSVSPPVKNGPPHRYRWTHPKVACF